MKRVDGLVRGGPARPTRLIGPAQIDRPGAESGRVKGLIKGGQWGFIANSLGSAS